MKVKDKLSIIEKQIAEVCSKAKRNPQDVKIIELLPLQNMYRMRGLPKH